MRIKNLDGATSMGHGGQTYEADANGMFDVPHEVGEALVGFPHWVREHEYIDQTAAARSAADKDPQTLAGRVAALESVVPHMLAGIQALETRLAELEAGAPAAEDATADAGKQDAAPEDEMELGDGEETDAPAKPQRARKTTASRRK